MERPVIFLDVDGVLNQVVKYDKGMGTLSEKYSYDRSKEFTLNYLCLLRRYKPLAICASTWRFNRSIDEINEALNRKIGLIQPVMFVQDKLKDRNEKSNWREREGIILEKVSELKTNLWLAIDDLPMKSIPNLHQVRPEVGEGFTAERLGEAFQKLYAQGVR